MNGLDQGSITAPCIADPIADGLLVIYRRLNRVPPLIALASQVTRSRLLKNGRLTLASDVSAGEDAVSRKGEWTCWAGS